jgi:saccharopine dehydrogenase-like NADP-dependent oxidoreductase
VLLADQSPAAAGAAAARVNQLLNTDRAVAIRLDVTDHGAVVAALAGIDAFLSAVPYCLNPAITRAAIEAGRMACAIWAQH